MKNSKNKKNVYENILGEVVIMEEEKVELGEKVSYIIVSPDRADPYEIEHVYGQGLPAELVREEVELTKAKKDFITKARVLGEDTIKERLGFNLTDIKEEREKGRLDIRLTRNLRQLKGAGEDLKRLVIPDFITSVGIVNNYFNIIEQLEIGENLRNFHCIEGLIIENIKLSSKNKYLKLIDGDLYSYEDELIVKTGYEHLEV